MMCWVSRYGVVVGVFCVVFSSRFCCIYVLCCCCQPTSFNARRVKLPHAPAGVATLPQGLSSLTPVHVHCRWGPGVPATASPATIRKAFLKVAKAQHPDVAQSSDSPAQAFVDAVLAYEVLSDPHRRAVYDAQRRVVQQAPPSAPRRRSQAPAAASPDTVGGGASENVHHGEAAVRDDDDAMRRVAERARGQSGSNFWKAVMHAFAGPKFDGDSSTFPYAFELEPRNDPESSTDVLHMVVGRQWLGSVRGGHMTPVGGERLELQPAPRAQLVNAVNSAVQLLTRLSPRRRSVDPELPEATTAFWKGFLGATSGSEEVTAPRTATRAATARGEPRSPPSASGPLTAMGDDRAEPEGIVVPWYKEGAPVQGEVDCLLFEYCGATVASAR